MLSRILTLAIVIAVVAVFGRDWSPAAYIGVLAGIVIFFLVSFVRYFARGQR
jgi:hypothetical protein